MALPTLLTTYPNNGDVGIPVGQALYLILDRGIDIDTAKKNIVLYGPDLDITSGPDSAQWIDPQEDTNPFFLRSPSFHGVVETTIELLYLESDDTLLNPQPDITMESDETDLEIHAKILITPNKPLAPDASYTLQVIGDPDTVDRGVSSRTVFDTVPDDANQSSTGEVLVYGGYTGVDDTLNIKITSTGEIGTAKYKWWYESQGEPSATIGRVTNRRFRRVQDGLQVRFLGSGFVEDDLYVIVVEAPERLAASYTIGFTTNDGSYQTAPDSPSTPATSSPPSSTIPLLTSDSGFTVVESSPSSGDSNLQTSERTITIEFSADIDPDTITDDNVTVWVYPVSGEYSDTYPKRELNKKLTVMDNLLTIEF